jgi:MerR family transcriptional regulator, mercuric resistance operon regulatory protein
MTYSIGELSRRTGVKVETIRYYERLKLLGQVSRSQSGRRLFTQCDMETLLFIRQCREMLFSIENIRALLPLRGKGPCSTVKVIASKHLDELRTKLKALAALERKLGEAVGRCPGDASPECSVLALLEKPERAFALA